MKTLKTLINILIIIIMLPILFISVVILINSYINPNEVPSFFGWKPFIVLSGSMESEIYPGDIAVVKEIDSDDLKINDVIAFRQEDIVITHRIIEIIDNNGEKQFITKGDNNNEKDQFPVNLEDIEGVFQFKIRGIGNFAMFLQTPTGMVICLSIPLAILIIMQFLGARQDKKISIENEKRKKDLQEEIERLKKENEELQKNKE